MGRGGKSKKENTLKKKAIVEMCVRELPVFIFFIFFNLGLYAQFNPSEIDREFTITSNGLYRLDSDFLLTPIYSNQGNIPWDNCITAYIQIGDIFFFSQINGTIIFYDFLTNSLSETDFYEIFNILFLSENKLEINGKVYNQDENRMAEKSIEINFEYRKTDQNIIGKTYSVKINGDAKYTVGSNIFLFNLFGKNIVFNLDNIIPEYSYANIIVLYNKRHNNYFIAVDNLRKSE